MVKPENETDDGKSASISEPSLQSESSRATSVSLETFSNGDSDIFDMSGDRRYLADETQTSAAGEDILSDLPAMQRQHMTAGYREGLSESKAKSMQGGFDEGYPIGFELGLRVGKIFGVIEGFLAAFAKEKTGAATEFAELYEKAKMQLAISELLKGLDDEVLARPAFGIKDLPPKSMEALQKWEELVRHMAKR